MDPELRQPLNRLAEALHRAIEESPVVDEALQALRDAGFRAYLLLEVTVALGSAKDDADPSRQMLFADVAEDGDDKGWVVEMDETPEGDAHGDLAGRVAPDDRDFLKSIRIRLD